MCLCRRGSGRKSTDVFGISEEGLGPSEVGVIGGCELPVATGPELKASDRAAGDLNC